MSRIPHASADLISLNSYDLGHKVDLFKFDFDLGCKVNLLKSIFDLWYKVHLFEVTSKLECRVD